MKKTVSIILAIALTLSLVLSFASCGQSSSDDKKTELTVAIAEKTELPKAKVADVLNAFFDTVAEQLGKGEAVQIIGFGNFEVAEYASRTGRNPQTGATLTIPAGKRPKFTAGTSLKKAVAK